MDFDAGFVSNISTLIASVGTPVTVTRSGATLFKTPAVFVNSKTVVDTALADSLLSKVNNGTADCYISGSAKMAPAPGDVLTGKNRAYTVLEVDVYQPALLVLAYKLVLE